MKKISILFLIPICLLIFAYSLNLKSKPNIIIIKASDKQKFFDYIYIEKGSRIKFNVSGKWTAWYPSWSPVDSRGHQNFRKIQGFHLGALMGKVEGGNPFVIYDGLVYRSRVSGYFIIYPHRKRYEHLKVNGQLEVSIEGFKYKKRELSKELVDIINDYKINYIGSKIINLNWNGSARRCRPAIPLRSGPSLTHRCPTGARARALQRRSRR